MVDFFYGWPALEAHDGFTAAQSIMNIVETVMYFAYLWIVYTYGFRESDKSGKGTSNAILGRRKIVGKEAGLAVLIIWSAAVMTVSKTLIYRKCFFSQRRFKADSKFPVLNEACSGFRHTGHNDWYTLCWAWIIPK
jgi:hypothetical protein